MEDYLRKTIPIDEMDCPSCALTIEKALKKLEGVKDVQINVLMKKVVITYDPKKLDVLDLENKIEDLGYRISYKKYESITDKILRSLKVKKDEEPIFRQVDDHNFEELVLKSRKPAILIVISPDCPSCKILLKKIKELEGKFLNRIYFFKMDIKTTNRWEEYNVTASPTVLYFKDGKTMDKQIVPDIEDVENRVKELIGN